MSNEQDIETVECLQKQEIIKGRWPAGISGNPSGRRTGSKNKATLAAQALLIGEVNAVTSKLIELAKNGDIQAIRIIFDKLLPNPRDRAVKFETGELRCSKDLITAVYGVTDAMARAEITPAEAANICTVLERAKSLVENIEFEDRIAKLERYAKARIEK